MNVANLEFFAKGKRGVVYTSYFKGKKVAIKKKNEKSEALNRIHNEAEILKMVNKHGIGPKLLSSGDDFVMYEFVEGKEFEDFVKISSEKELKKAVKEILKQCFILDKLKIDKGELHRPTKNMIVGKKAVLIDFERARKSLNPRNVTQFCQFLGREQKLNIDKEKIRNLAKKYKEDYSEKIFNKIIRMIE